MEGNISLLRMHLLSLIPCTWVPQYVSNAITFEQHPAFLLGTGRILAHFWTCHTATKPVVHVGSENNCTCNFVLHLKSTHLGYFETPLTVRSKLPFYGDRGSLKQPARSVMSLVTYPLTVGTALFALAHNIAITN